MGSGGVESRTTAAATVPLVFLEKPSETTNDHREHIDFLESRLAESIEMGLATCLT